MEIASVIISVCALFVSIFAVLRNEIWQKRNRKNDIKPFINLNFVDCYTEGYVPQIWYQFENQLGKDVQFYLKIENIGIGMASNIKVYYTNDFYQIEAGTFPLTIKPGDSYILTILAEKVTIDNEFQIDVSYEDIDGNVYYISSKGIYLQYEKEYHPRMTNIIVGKDIYIKPSRVIAARYIEEEI